MSGSSCEAADGLCSSGGACYGALKLTTQFVVALIELSTFTPLSRERRSQFVKFSPGVSHHVVVRRIANCIEALRPHKRVDALVI